MSYSEKLKELRRRLEDHKVIVLDPKNEYEKMAKSLDGEVIKIDPSKSSYINVFDIGEEEVDTIINEKKERWSYTLDISKVTSLAQLNDMLKDYMRSYNTTFHRGIDAAPMERFQNSKDHREQTPL